MKRKTIIMIIASIHYFWLCCFRGTFLHLQECCIKGAKSAKLNSKSLDEFYSKLSDDGKINASTVIDELNTMKDEFYSLISAKNDEILALKSDVKSSNLQ